MPNQKGPKSFPQTKFSKGEVSPSFHGRSEAVSYQEGLAEATNVYVKPTGGVVKRPGTSFIASLGFDVNAVKMFTFKFREGDHYVMLVAAGYTEGGTDHDARVFFFRNKVPILRNISNQSYTYVQNDTSLYTVLPSSWSSSNESGRTSNRIYLGPLNTTINARILYFFKANHGMETGDLIQTSINTRPYSIANQIFPIRKVSNHCFVLEGLDFGGENVVDVDNLSGSPKVIFKPLYKVAVNHDDWVKDNEVFDLKLSQSADVITFTHLNYPPLELKRRGHNNWEQSFRDIQAREINFNRLSTLLTDVSNNDASGTETKEFRYAVTVFNLDTNEESFPARSGSSFAFTLKNNPDGSNSTIAEVTDRTGFTNEKTITFKDLATHTAVADRASLPSASLSEVGAIYYVVDENQWVRGTSKVITNPGGTTETTTSSVCGTNTSCPNPAGNGWTKIKTVEANCVAGTSQVTGSSETACSTNPPDTCSEPAGSGWSLTNSALENCTAASSTTQTQTTNIPCTTGHSSNTPACSTKTPEGDGWTIASQSQTSCDTSSESTETDSTETACSTSPPSSCSSPAGQGWTETSSTTQECSAETSTEETDSTETSCTSGQVPSSCSNPAGNGWTQSSTSIVQCTSGGSSTQTSTTQTSCTSGTPASCSRIGWKLSSSSTSQCTAKGSRTETRRTSYTNTTNYIFSGCTNNILTCTGSLIPPGNWTYTGCSGPSRLNPGQTYYCNWSRTVTTPATNRRVCNWSRTVTTPATNKRVCNWSRTVTTPATSKRVCNWSRTNTTNIQGWKRTCNWTKTLVTPATTKRVCQWIRQVETAGKRKTCTWQKTNPSTQSSTYSYENIPAIKNFIGKFANDNAAKGDATKLDDFFYSISLNKFRVVSTINTNFVIPQAWKWIRGSGNIIMDGTNYPYTYETGAKIKIHGVKRSGAKNLFRPFETAICKTRLQTLSSTTTEGDVTTTTVRDISSLEPASVELTWHALTNTPGDFVYKIYRSKPDGDELFLLDTVRGTRYKDWPSAPRSNQFYIGLDEDEQVTTVLSLFTDNYPSVVAHFNQRKIFANTFDQPDTIFFSGINAFSDFEAGTKDDDGIHLTLAGQRISPIEALVPLKDLFVFTQEAVWKMTTIADEAFTATNIKAIKVDFEGTAERIQPITIDENIIYVTNDRKNIKIISNEDSFSLFDSFSLTELSRHFFENNTIVNWAYNEERNMLIVIMDDGQARCMTFYKDHDVLAWTNWKTPGQFIDILEGPERDSFYFLVQRDNLLCFEHMTFTKDNDFDHGHPLHRMDCSTRIEGNQQEIVAIDYDGSDGRLALSAKYVPTLNPFDLTNKSGIPSDSPTSNLFYSQTVNDNDRFSIHGSVKKPSTTDYFIDDTNNKLNDVRFDAEAIGNLTEVGFQAGRMNLYINNNAFNIILTESDAESLLKFGRLIKNFRAVMGAARFYAHTDLTGNLLYSEVGILRDGVYTTDVPSIEGYINIGEKGSFCQVGVPFTARVKTLPIENAELTPDMLSKPVNVAVKVHETGDFLYHVEDDLVQTHRTQGKLVSELIVSEVYAGWGESKQLTLTSPWAYPFELLSITLDTALGDEEDARPKRGRE